MMKKDEGNLRNECVNLHAQIRAVLRRHEIGPVSILAQTIGILLYEAESYN